MLDELDILTLNGPAGNGQANDPADISALDNALRYIEAYTPPPEYAGEPQRYATEPMIRALEKYQEQNGLKVDGYANPNGPTERAINNRLLEKPKGTGLLFDPPAPLAGTVGNGFENRRDDVATVQRILGALDHLPEDPFDRPRGFIDENITGAIQSFQRKRGLDPDGWLAPGGETERALHEAVSDLARVKGREWLRFAERAGRAQSQMMERLSARTGPSTGNEDEAAHVMPAAWRGTFPEPDSARPADTPAPTDGDGRVEPAQTAPGDWIVPFLFLTLPGLLGVGEANRQRTERQRLDDEASGSKTELIPPHVPNEPFRGPDPARPPLRTKETQPSPYPSQSPHKPEQERLAPPQIDPRDFIIVFPDLSDWISRFPIIVKNRIGDPPVQDVNRDLGTPIVGIGEKVFGDGSTRQIGGPLPHPSRGRLKETFDSFRYKKEFGITSNYGGSFEDVSYLITYKGVTVKFVINTVTTNSGGMPITRENRQRARVVLNSLEDTVIAEVDKPSATEKIDLNAWQGFVESRMHYIKHLIDNNVLTPRGDADAERRTQKVLDFFRYNRGR